MVIYFSSMSFPRIGSKQHYPFRAANQDGEIVDVFL